MVVVIFQSCESIFERESTYVMMLSAFLLAAFCVITHAQNQRE